MTWKLLKRLTNTKQTGADIIDDIDFDPDCDGFIQNPYPVFSYLRNNDPLYMSKHGVWVVTRYKDIEKVLLDGRISNLPASYAVLNKSNRNKYVCADVASNCLPFLDGEGHKRLRQIIAPIILNAIRGGSINVEALANEIMNSLHHKRTFDFLHEFATPLSLLVLCQIFGFPKEDGKKLKYWSDYFFYMFSIMPSVEIREQTDQALLEFRNYVSDVVELRKVKKGKDLISKLLNVRDKGAIFTDQELVDNCMLIFADGVGNVDSGLANLLALLLKNPEQLDLLYRDKSLISAAVDEALRYESPGQFIARVALEDIQWYGKIIKKNQAIFLVLGSANRDKSVFNDPDKFDINRKNSKEALSFGKGSHSCLGAHLVRLEMDAAINVLLSAFSNIQLKDDNLKWRHRMAHRWLESLPIKVFA